MKDYKECYQEAIDRLILLKELGSELKQVPAMGFTSNLDIVLKWNADTYNGLLDKYVQRENPPKVIESIEDFLGIASEYMKKGLGGNFDILSENVCKFLDRTFEREFSLGGTCAQAAAALGSLGIPCHIHLTDTSKRVCDFLSYPQITCNWHDKRVAVKDIESDRTPVCHYILQFAKDDVLHFKDEHIKIPCSNRLILFFDQMQKKVPIWEAYIKYVEEQAASFSSYLISGFDAIVDKELMQKKALLLKEHFKRVKKKNPKIVLYYENAFYMNEEVNRICLKMWAKQADIVGLNEEELQTHIKGLGKSSSIDSLKTILSSLKYFRETYGIKGLVLHSKDYALYYGSKLEGVDIEGGLLVGNILSSTRARTGKYGNIRDCQSTLSLELSKRGLDLCREREGLDVKEELIVVPTKYMEHPKYTIGLGDTFTAGLMTGFIKLCR